MEQLSGLDGMFLHAELPNMPMTISPLTIYDASSAPQGIVRFKDILKVFETGLLKASVFRRRLVEVPFNIDHPYWIEDPNFDIEFHVRHIALPEPGDWRQLFIQAARLQSRPIDRTRPLWEAYVIEGLNNLEGIPKGSFAILLKIHHAAMDGVTGMEVFTTMHDFQPKPPEQEPAPTTYLVEERPSRAALFAKASRNYVKRSLKMAKIASEGMKAYKRIQEGKKQGLFRSLDDKIKTRFNGIPSSHRTVTKFTMQFDDVRSIRQCAKGSTVNDVMLTVVGGAMLRYLTAKDETPDGTLISGCPIDVRTDENRHVRGNIISLMNVSMCTDITDPIERLGRISDESKQSKQYSDALGPMMVNDVTQNLPPYLLSLGARASVGLGEKVPTIHHTVVTNVPGLQIPAYFCGAKLIDSFGLGPCMPNCGLFHTVTSLYDTITIAVTSCREMIPDPDFYWECLQESYIELKTQADEYEPPVIEETEESEQEELELVD